MSRFRLVFFGTPEFAVASLKHLLNDEHFEVAAVVSQPDRPAGRSLKLASSPVRLLAESAGLVCLTPENVNAPEVLAELGRFRAEVGVVVAFGQILSTKLLQVFPHGCVNVHASILPRWRGAAPIQRAIMAGDRESGVCLQKVVRKLDAGDVLGARRLAIGDEMDAQALHDKLKLLGADLLHVELMDYLRGNLVAWPQDETLVTLASKIDKAEANIVWARPARQIFNQIRGLTMGPGALARTATGLRLKIWRAHLREELSSTSGVPGCVRPQELARGDLVIDCEPGALELVEVQPENKPRMAARDFARGAGLKAGESWS